MVLTAAVLAAHLWALRGTPAAFHPSAPWQARTLVTRAIVAAPVAAAGDAAGAHAQAPAAVRPPARAVASRVDPPSPARPQDIAGSAATPPAGATEAARGAAQAPPTSAQSVAVAGSVLLRYKVTAHARNQLWHAGGELHWRHDGSEYEARLELSAPLFPSRVQQSSGRITAQGLAPLRFSDRARTEEAAHFQREEGKVSFSSNRPDAALMAGAQDRLSVLLQLGAFIAGDPKKFPPASTLVIQTAGTRDAEPWEFTVEGEERLELPGGALNTLKLTRKPRREFDQKVELWLAPAMDYVPVRLRLTQPNGDWVDQQWSSTDRG
jgi:hypothetical protein